jgi:hypothetical protein
MKKLTVVLSFLLALAASAFGQTILTTTTLSSAVTSSATTSLQLASSTGVTAGSTMLFIADTGNSGEAVFVNSVAATGGYVGVTRGVQSLGGAGTHASGALVFIGAPFAFATVQPSGSCTRSKVPYLPVIALGAIGTATSISDCVGGVWVSGITAGATMFRVPAPNPGGVLYTGVGTSTATVAGTLYCTEIDLPFNKLLTGIGKMNGATASTDNHIVALYDATGNLVAKSAAAGVLAASASNYQTIAFTTSYYAVGPAQYFGCVQSNGTTATLNMVKTGMQDTYLTKSIAGVFATIPATITVPTTFTTVVGPYLELY